MNNVRASVMAKLLFFHCFVRVAVVGLSQQHATAGEALDADNVVGHVVDALNGYRNVSLKAIATVEQVEQNGAHRLKAIYNLSLRRSPDRSFLSMKAEVQRPSKEPFRQQYDKIIDVRGAMLSIQTPLDSSGSQHMERQDRLFVALDDAELTGTEARGLNDAIQGLNESGIVALYLGYSPISVFFTNKNAIRVSVDESSGDFILDVVDPKHGHFTARVSAASGWLPTDYALVKTGQNETAGGPVAKVFKDPSAEVLWEVEARNLTPVDSKVEVPMDYIVRRSTSFDGVVTSVKETYLEIVELKFRPEFTPKDFQTQLKIPNETRVWLMGADPVDLRWTGGSVVLKDSNDRKPDRRIFPSEN